jgi:hypothetical protein
VSAPARLMRGAICERIVLERGSVLSVRLAAGPGTVVRITDLKAGPHGEIYADLERVG